MSNALHSLLRAGSFAAVFGCSAIASLPAQTASAVAVLQPPVQASRVALHPDFAPQAQLTGHIPGWITSGRQVSRAVDLAASMHVSIVLSRDAKVQTAFERLLADQQDRSSPLYHQWLTPQQIGGLYGPTTSDVAAVSAWLISQGLTVESIAPSRLILEVSGSIASVASAFRTSFGYFASNGEPHLSAIAEPSIPVALAPVIKSIHGLTQLPLEPMSHITPAVQPMSAIRSSSGPRPNLTVTSGGVTEYFMVPKDFDVIYDLANLKAAGNTGATIGTATQKIAIIGRSRVVAADITNFELLTALPAITPTVVLASSVDPGTPNNGDTGEATLDVQRVIGTAPGAEPDLVISGTSGGNDGVYVSASYNVNTLKDPIMTISFGSCERSAGLSGVDLWDSLFSSAAAEGISVFVSAGDSGAAGCDTAFMAAPATQYLSPNYICSSSYATCVGGTEFNDASNYTAYWSSTNGTGLESALQYIPEGAWNEPTEVTNGVTSYVVAAGGGGVSSYIAKPSWQTGTGVPADGFRDTPDVSFSAAEHDGYFGCLTYSGGSCVTANGSTPFVAFSGTSAAAPGMAGIAALLNTKAAQAQGNINPLLYGFAASTPAAFHDVTVATSGVTACSTATPSMCNNSTPGPSTLTGGLAGYAVTAGYDQATGLGSLDVGNFIAAVAAEPAIGVTAASSTLSFTSGATSGNTDAITLSSINSFSGSVALSCSISTSSAADPPSCAIAPSPVTLSAGQTQSAVVTISSTTAHADISSPLQLGLGWRATGGVVLAMVLCFLPVRRRRAFRSLAALGLLALGMASLSGCGGGGGSAKTVQSSAGTYTVTVGARSTASGTTTTGSTTFALTIN